MRILAKQPSGDGMTTTYVQETNDGQFRILTTYVDRPEKRIVCFTCSVGCPVGCKFCSAGDDFVPLPVGEIFHQAYLVHKDQELQEKTMRPDGKPVLFSAMGEGEPLASRLIFERVVSAMRAMGSVFPKARLALSTSAPHPELVRELATINFPTDFKLQISLISAREGVRKLLTRMSATLVEIRGAVGYYEQVSGRSVEWNMVLLDGVNDTNLDAYNIVNLLGPGAKVKLNGYNPAGTKEFRKSSRTLEFASLLSSYGIKTEVYQTDGWDVGAACGQFHGSRISGEFPTP